MKNKNLREQEGFGGKSECGKECREQEHNHGKKEHGNVGREQRREQSGKEGFGKKEHKAREDYNRAPTPASSTTKEARADEETDTQERTNTKNWY